MPDNENTCQHHEALCQRIDNMITTQQAYNGTMKEISEALGDGKVNFKDLKVRLSIVEKVVYGAVGIILLAFLTALVNLVIYIVK